MHARENVRGMRFVWRLLFNGREKDLLIRSADFSLSYPVMQVLASRGMRTTEAIEEFLFTPARPHLHEAEGLKGLDTAAARIEAALAGKERILIVGDYDVDGITATSLVLEGLIRLGAQVNFFIPNRFVDGYGLNKKIVERAHASGYQVVITVDNGITAVEAAQRALELDIDLIITDHHTPHALLPKAYALVNPKQPGCPYECKELAGVGVAYKLIAALYQRQKLPIPDCVYELLLLGTIADVVPLVGENRSLVRYGLTKIRDRESLALSALRSNARLERQLTSQDIGFSLAPQLNALGRLEDPREGVLFLLGTESNEVARIGRRLYELNQLRKEKERQVFDAVQATIASGEIALDQSFALIAVGEHWPAGVIGLTAGRLSQLYGRPVFLFHRAGDVYKGSCRSVQGINVFELLQSVTDMDIQFGGHSAAAGLSVPSKEFERFKDAIQSRLKELVSLEDLVPLISCDAELSLDEVHVKLVKDLSLLEPFGAANDRPLFYLSSVQVTGNPQLLKEEHVKCMVTDRGVVKPLIFFNRPELYSWLIRHEGALVDVAAYVQENEFRGRKSVDLQGVDIRLHEEQ